MRGCSLRRTLFNLRLSKRYTGAHSTAPALGGVIASAKDAHVVGVVEAVGYPSNSRSLRQYAKRTDTRKVAIISNQGVDVYGNRAGGLHCIG